MGKPIMGVIHVPVSDELYIGLKGEGAFKIQGKDYKGLKYLFHNENKIPNPENRKYTVVGSRSHMSAETEEFINKKKVEKGEVDILSKGSSLKLCMLAEGKADDYPRFAPTMEWDTAAGHAILSAAGGKVINWRTKEDLKYNKENLLNEWFLATI
jgi:3'(2'), 5'-bisphosphate nucleotidase